jgi:hypothetical protein
MHRVCLPQQAGGVLRCRVASQYLAGTTDVRGALGEGGETKWKRPWSVRSTRGKRRREAR